MEAWLIEYLKEEEVIREQLQLHEEEPLEETSEVNGKEPASVDFNVDFTV